MKRLLALIGLLAGLCFGQGSTLPLCDQQTSQHCIYWKMPATLSSDYTSQSYTPWTYQGYVVGGATLGNLDTSTGLHTYWDSGTTKSFMTSYQSTGVLGPVQMEGNIVTLADGSGGTVVVNAGGIITAFPSGLYVELGSANSFFDKLGDLQLSATASVITMPGTAAGILLANTTPYNAIQAPVGGMSAEMFTGNGHYIYQTGATYGSKGGYLDLALLSYPPYSGGGCTDVWANTVTFPTPTPQQASGFGANDGVFWNGPSPLFGAAPSNCAPSPFINFGSGTVNTSGTAVTLVSGTPFQNSWVGEQIEINNIYYVISTVNSTSSITLATSAGSNTGVVYNAGGQQVLNGISVNEYIGTLAGLASFSSAFNSIQSLTGGGWFGTTIISGQPWFTQGYASSASLATPGNLQSYVVSAAFSSAGSGSVTGTSGQYCAVGPFNGGGYGAQALLTLAGTNTLSGSTISFVNPISGVNQGGQLYTSAPTQGVLNNGNQVVWPGHVPASCSGTINITSSITALSYGGLSYQGGNVYWYWNGSAWATVDFSHIGVSSLNTLVGALTLAPTTNEISITASGGNTLTFATPQAIASTSNVTFGSVQSNGPIQSTVGSGYGYVLYNGSIDSFLVDYLGDITNSGNTITTGFITTATWLGLHPTTSAPGTSPGGGYGALAYDGGATYWYWNGSAWATVNFSTSGGSDWTLTGNYLYPNSTSYIVLAGLTSTDVSLGASGFVTGGSLVAVSAASNALVGSLAAIGGNYFAISSGHSGSGTTEPIAFFIDSVDAGRWTTTSGTQGALLINETSNSSGANLEVNGSISTNGSTGFVQATATGTNIAFQTSSPYNFQVNGNGAVSSANIVYAHLGGYFGGNTTDDGTGSPLQQVVKAGTGGAGLDGTFSGTVNTFYLTGLSSTLPTSTYYLVNPSSASFPAGQYLLSGWISGNFGSGYMEGFVVSIDEKGYSNSVTLVFNGLGGGGQGGTATIRLDGSHNPYVYTQLGGGGTIIGTYDYGVALIKVM